MKRFTQRMSLLLAAAVIVPAASQAAGFRAYLASSGADNPSCGVSTPCRFLPAALAAVSDGGEVWILDSANFNTSTVSINQNVTILAIPGQIGSIVAVGGGAAITIGAGKTVKMRNVSILNNIISPGTDGIQMPSGGVLFIQDSIVSVPGDGIVTTDGTVDADNVTFRDSSTGVHARGNANVSVSRSKFSGITFVSVYQEGNVAGTSQSASITDSFFANSNMSLGQNGTTSATLRATMSRCTVTRGTWGIDQAATGGEVVVANISDSSFEFLNVGFQSTGGAVMETISNNQVRFNNTTGTATPVSPF